MKNAVLRRVTLGVECALVLTLLSPRITHAQGAPGTGFNEDLLASWQWRNIGPNRGGRSIAVAGSVSRPLEYYFGATGGGVWKTTDAGTNWTPVSDRYFNTTSVGALGVCESDPDIVYAGTGEADFRGTMSTGDGVYGTRDGGATWTFLGLESSTGQTAVARVRVHPQDCDLVYAGVLGDPYGPNEVRGVYRSRDGGRSWERVLFRSDRAGVADLVIDPNDPGTLYATIWDVRRRPWGAVSGGQSGIFKSSDGGDTWVELTHNPGLPEVRIGKVGIAVSGADGDRVYALVEAEPGVGGMYRSDDAGATWRLMNAHHSLITRAEYYVRVVADPVDPDRVYVLEPYFFRSDDGGRTYSQIAAPHGDHHDLWIDPTDNGRMVQANDGGANVSWNAGRTWTEQDYPTAQLYHVTTTNHFPYHVCGAQQDNSTACVPSDGDGSYLYDVGGGESGYIQVDPTNPDITYAGSYRGFLTRYDRATGQAQNVQVWPLNNMGEAALEQRERFQWTFPIVMSPHDPGVVYAASQHVWRTSSGGSEWTRISPDLTRADPETLTGSELLVRNENTQDYYATIFALTVSPHDANTIWAGSDDGLVHVTRDGGANWQDVTPPGLRQFTRVSMIEVSPHVAGKAYLALERYKSQDVSPYIFRTEDYGDTWSEVVDGIPHGDFVRVVREDPLRPGLLFAGTEYGPYVSFDDGVTWRSLRLNLPRVQVSDLVVRDNDVVISTYGRSAYILDGIMPVLRELAPTVLASGFHLFDPADAFRTEAQATEPYGRVRTPGINAVEVDYHLSSAAESVALEFLDARGRVVRAFSGVRGERPVGIIRDDVGHGINGPRWGQEGPPPRVGTDAGLHRFSWNMRVPPVTSFPGMLLRGGASGLGPVVPPGRYRVRMTVDGIEQSADFRIRGDPRLVDVSQADLEERFELAMRIHRRLDQATSTVSRIRRIVETVEARVGEAGDPAVTRAGESLRVSLLEVEEALYPVGVMSQKGPLHFGGRLTNKIGTVLQNVVEASDSRPPAQAYEVFEELSAALDGELAKLEDVLGEDLDRFNGLLRAQGLEPVGRAMQE